jgi:hypothetical protein
MPHPCLVRLLTLAVFSNFASFSASAISVEKLGSLPQNSHPARVLIQGPDGYLYGVLRQTGYSPELGTTIGATSGAVYRLSPDGEVKYLHKFENANGAPNNPTGSVPWDLACFGSDGCLYGLTAAGGIHGRGVFYRLTTNGEYTVIAHLQGSTPWNFVVRFFSGFVQKADGFFYTFDSDERRLVRFGLDGSYGYIGERHIPYGGGHQSVMMMQDPFNEANLIICSAEPRGSIRIRDKQSVIIPNPNQITIRTVGCAEGNLISERKLQPYSAEAWYPAVVRVTETEVIVVVQSTGDPGDGSWGPGQIISINSNDEVTVLADIDEPIPYEITGVPAMQLLMASDGSFFYSAGEQTKGSVGVQGGSRIYHLERNGTNTQVCDFDGYPLIAMCEAREGVIYGASFGPNVEFDPAEPEVPVAATTLASTARARASAPRHPALVKHGTFRINPIGVNVNLAPYTGVDVARLGPPINGVTPSCRIRPLLNDRDPERKPLTLTQVNKPAFGVATIENGAKGHTEVVYTPNITPSRSEVIHYTVADEGGETSLGVINVRGDVAGRYRTPDFKPKADNSLQFSVARTGKFSVAGKAQGIRISGAGSLDFDDRGRIDRVLRNGTSWSLDVELQNADSTNNILSYRLKIGDQELVGTAVR